MLSDLPLLESSTRHVLPLPRGNLASLLRSQRLKRQLKRSYNIPILRYFSLNPRQEIP